MDIALWMDSFLQALNATFGNRVWFVGLQGSYSRGEATENSDIDTVVILDNLSPGDVHTYQQMLDTLPHREKICGFLSGKADLLHWEPADLFQFYYDTEPIQGSLDELLPLLDDDAVARAIKTGAGNLFHGCVHNMLHEQSCDMLKSLYKSASFVAQAVYFRQTGRYVRRQTELLEMAAPEERGMVETFLKLKGGAPVEFVPMSERLLVWAQAKLNG